MASSRLEIGVKLRQMLIQGWLLWLIGFKEACCLHRVVILCYRSRRLLRRTGQCFLFNGFIFLGSDAPKKSSFEQPAFQSLLTSRHNLEGIATSVSILNSFVIPTLQWILPDHCPHIVYEEICRRRALSNLYLAMRKVLMQLFYVFWFYPLYVFSLILSTIWYNDIAQQGFIAMGEHQSSSAHNTTEEKASTGQNAVPDKPAGLGGVMIGIGEQVYSALLLSFFFLEVFVTGFIPYVGQALNFLLLSWMYAYYCFEYKWNLSGVPLDRRLDFFESNWAFFAGFGSPCVLAIFFFPPLKSYAVMATLFPLFVLTATGSHADNLVSSPRKQWLGAGLGRLPIFCVADTLSMKVLAFLPWKPHEH